ncbi:MAG: hypothetical protein F6K26_24420 [Moorea sp. SIO2I5]|nr:hypothetical protein [Moorena sp. SIO2I5]
MRSHSSKTIGAFWWNGHLAPILPIDKIRASLLVVRYGADYPNSGDEAKNKGKSAPNAPYWTPVFLAIVNDCTYTLRIL